MKCPKCNIELEPNDSIDIEPLVEKKLRETVTSICSLCHQVYVWDIYYSFTKEDNLQEVN